MAGWTTLAELVLQEVTQSSEEGRDAAGFEDKVKRAGSDREALLELYWQLRRLPVVETFPYSEPNGLADIRALRPHGPRSLPLDLDSDALFDRFYGAWLGRCIGCALGKPLEQPPFMGGSGGRRGWQNVKLWFEGADAWPIADYTPKDSEARTEYGIDVNVHCFSTKDDIAYMESDDDIRYTVVGLAMMEEKGRKFDAWDMGKLWHRLLPYQMMCTAETQAYLNFAQVTSHMHGERPDDWEETIDWVRTYLNPYREWIGAQIRADGLAYAAAGQPELAAELGWQDASLSHVKNGIYGEMMIAAMIAAAFAESDPKRLVEIGLSEIPSTSRLAADVKTALELAEQLEEPESLVDALWDHFDHYHPVHTNNNAALVCASLIHGQRDFTKTLALSVMGGWDTDCNGATVGSILGAQLGADALPQHWAAPLHDTLYSSVAGFDPISIAECAHRSMRTYHRQR